MLYEAPAKRAKTSTATARATVLAVLTTEPAVLKNIVSFIPTTSCTSAVSGTRTQSKQAVALETIAILCQAIPGLSASVGPANEAFWREMVLAHFDFTVGPERFNVEDQNEEIDDIGGDGDDDECDDDAYASWHRHPGNGPMAEWEQARSTNGESIIPSQFLAHDMHYWTSLRTYFNPTVYGFLREVQQDPSRAESLWPDHEDAFSLFCDLSLLPHFQSTSTVEWKSRCANFDDQPAVPCFLGRFPTKIVGQGYALLKFCGIVPHYWNYVEENSISARWSGFDGPRPAIACRYKKLQGQQIGRDADVQVYPVAIHGDRGKGPGAVDVYSQDHSQCEEHTEEEDSLFPMTHESEHDFQRLRRFVYDKFKDWRRVHIAPGDYYPGPEFLIGSMKRSDRWMGFVSESDWGGC